MLQEQQTKTWQDNLLMKCSLCWSSAMFAMLHQITLHDCICSDCSLVEVSLKTPSTSGSRCLISDSSIPSRVPSQFDSYHADPDPGDPYHDPDDDMNYPGREPHFISVHILM